MRRMSGYVIVFIAFSSPTVILVVLPASNFFRVRQTWEIGVPFLVSSLQRKNRRSSSYVLSMSAAIGYSRLLVRIEMEIIFWNVSLRFICICLFKCSKLTHVMLELRLKCLNVTKCLKIENTMLSRILSLSSLLSLLGPLSSSFLLPFPLSRLSTTERKLSTETRRIRKANEIRCFPVFDSHFTRPRSC